MRKYEFLGIGAGLIAFALGWYLMTHYFGHNTHMHYQGMPYESAPARQLPD